MELKDFLEKFLPDYEAKFQVKLENAPYFYDDFKAELFAQNDLFPEALQHFADKICEKQIQFCAEVVLANTDWEIDDCDILYAANNPNIDEL